MSTSPPPLPTCSNCQTTLDPNGSCPRCRAPQDWNDHIEAVDFVVRRLRDWHQQGKITDRQLEALADIYAKRRLAMEHSATDRQIFQAEPTYTRRDTCWSCAEYLYTNASHCQSCGAPVTNPAVRSLRYWQYLHGELRQHEEAGWLTLRQAHEFLGDTEERIEALRRKLEQERAPFVLPVDDEPGPEPRRRRRREEPEEPAADEGPRRTLLEVLLDPHSIQWLLAAGGVLIVVGLIIWLTSLGLFDNPRFMAVLLGLGNAALVAGGWFLILRSPYRNAGLAITLLACLLLPLNLWFYHTHNLLTLDNHLWAAALACCIVYVASALVLRDSLFVYVLVGGITLTGLLFLAQVNRFGEILAPTLFLMVLGLICLHAERAFPVLDSPFSRDRFGMAFYWSSQGLFAVALLLLLGAQFVGWLHDPVFKFFGMREPPDVSKKEFLPWTLFIVLAGTYAYIYSDLVVRKIGIYLYLAAITLLWAEIQLLVLFTPDHLETVVIITLALTGLAVNLLHTSLQGKHDFLRTVVPLGLLLSLLPVALGVLLHFRATNVGLHWLWPYEITWPLVGAMTVTALCCRVGAHLHQNTQKEISYVYFFATAAATLLGAAELAWMLGLRAWESEAPLLMAIPILYLIASYLYQGRPAQKPLVWAAHAATVVMIVCSLWAAVVGQVEKAEPVAGAAHNLLLAAFCLEAAIFYGLAGALYRSQVSLYLSAVMFCGAVWQLLLSMNLPNELYPIAFALTGFALIVLYRFGVFEKMEMPTLDRAIFQSGNALTTIGFAAGALLSLSRLFLSEQALARLDNPDGGGDWRNPIRVLLYVTIFLTIVSLLSAWLVQHPVWRRVHLVLSIVNGLLIVWIFHTLNTLDPWQKLEIFSIVVGLSLLVIGYVGWYRETEGASDLVSFALLCGSVALVLPLLIAVGVHRFHLHQHGARIDDLGLIVACVALFGGGVLSRVKATTLTGAGALTAYLLIILIDLHRHLEQQWIIGIYLTLGGVALFGTGLILSIYRDRLLLLPERIRRREGIFRIFDWR
jgi:hypothetical protein